MQYKITYQNGSKKSSTIIIDAPGASQAENQFRKDSPDASILDICRHDGPSSSSKKSYEE